MATPPQPPRPQLPSPVASPWPLQPIIPGAPFANLAAGLLQGVDQRREQDMAMKEAMFSAAQGLAQNEAEREYRFAKLQVEKEQMGVDRMRYAAQIAAERAGIGIDRIRAGATVDQARAAVLRAHSDAEADRRDAIFLGRQLGEVSSAIGGLDELDALEQGLEFTPGSDSGSFGGFRGTDIPATDPYDSGAIVTGGTDPVIEAQHLQDIDAEMQRLQEEITGPISPEQVEGFTPLPSGDGGGVDDTLVPLGINQEDVTIEQPPATIGPGGDAQASDGAAGTGDEEPPSPSAEDAERDAARAARKTELTQQMVRKYFHAKSMEKSSPNKEVAYRWAQFAREVESRPYLSAEINRTQMREMASASRISGPGLDELTEAAGAVTLRVLDSSEISGMIDDYRSEQTAVREFTTITETERSRAGALLNAAKALPRIQHRFNAAGDTATGPILGRIQRLLGNYGPANAIALEKEVDSFINTYARGIAGEVGVLTNADFDRYKALFPTIKTPQDVGNLLLKMMRDRLSDQAKSFVDQMSAFGQDYAPVQRLFEDRGLIETGWTTTGAVQPYEEVEPPPGAPPATAATIERLNAERFSMATGSAFKDDSSGRILGYWDNDKKEWFSDRARTIPLTDPEAIEKIVDWASQRAGR